MLIQKTAHVDGKAIIVTILSLSQGEGWTVPQAAEYLGCDVSNIKHRAREHGINFVTLGTENAKSLRKLGVIPFRGRTPNFVPKESIKALVKVINTPQAWAIYSQLWEVVEDAFKYDEASLRKILGDTSRPALSIIHTLSGDLMKTQEALTETKDKLAEVWAKRHEADNRRALKSMSELGILTKKYRKLEEEVTKLKSRSPQQEEHFTTTAALRKFPEIQERDTRRLGKLLTSLSKELGKHPIKVRINGAVFREVNAYPISVIQKFLEAVPSRH